MKCLSVLVLIALLLLAACTSTPTATTSLPLPSPTSAPAIASPARSTPAPTLTPTLTPARPSALAPSTATATPAAAKYAFHINFLMDETTTCPGNARCDNAFIPKMILYFRGEVAVAANRVASGDGIMTFTRVDACQTLLPDTSSCKVNGVTNGSFMISGRMEGEKLRMTLHPREMPKLSVTMTSKHPSGPVTTVLDGTYQEELKRVFANAGIFDTEIQAMPTAASGDAAAYFEGSYTFGKARTLHGYGGLFFIAPDAPLPAGYKP